MVWGRAHRFWVANAALALGHELRVCEEGRADWYGRLAYELEALIEGVF
jgi:hypothetical protein